jgi:predicted metal-dependent peptidase
MLSIGKQLSAEQRIEKAVVSIMGNDRYVALAGVLMIGDRKVTDDVPTACTNGRDEMYGRAFVDNLSDSELRFLILHECYHKLYRHLTTWQHLYKKDANLANQACDYNINGKLVDENQDGFATMPDGGLYSDRFRSGSGWHDSAHIFNTLSQEQDDDDNAGQQGNTGFDEHDWDGAQELTAPEQEELERNIAEAVRQGALIAGKLGTGGNRNIDELLEPQINWREVLREFITTTCAGSDYSTWRRPNRRFVSSGVYMPSGISEQVDELVVAIDTSGSIGTRELTLFLSEIKSVCDNVHPESVRVLYWDAQVQGDEKYERHELDNLVKSTKPMGGGGTDVECVPKYMQDNNISAQAVIVLTDGYLYGGWGNWSQPLLWCVLDNKSANPDVGQCVHIKSNNM